MSEWRKENVEAMQRVAGQYATDDQEMYNRFIKRYNVYREDDRLVELVRNMTKPEDPESVRKLILSDPGSSLYTKSMVKGYENILAAQDYFGGSLCCLYYKLLHLPVFIANIVIGSIK